MKEKSTPIRLAKAMFETAKDMKRAGVMDERAYTKITMHHLDGKETAELQPLAGEDIRVIRQQVHMSQAVFAHHLNVTVGCVSQLERNAKDPTGPALVLLNVIRRKGIEAIL
jgi:putative transcriptional regulator